MENSRLGCLTRSGLYMAFAAAAIFVAVMIFQGNVLFSPGPLNAQVGKPLGDVSSHAAIGGHCDSCHAPFWSSAGMSALCLSCHTEIVSEQSDPQTLHGALEKGGIKGLCWTCHPEHGGANASLTLINPPNFPHSQLGFPLDGKHAVIRCSACHAKNVYSKLPFDCKSCHPTPASHVGQFPNTCETCHTSNDWSASFNHPRSCGRVDCLNHHRATCADCHPKDYSTSTCTKCHRNNPGED